MNKLEYDIWLRIEEARQLEAKVEINRLIESSNKRSEFISTLQETLGDYFPILINGHVEEADGEFQVSVAFGHYAGTINRIGFAAARLDMNGRAVYLYKSNPEAAQRDLVKFLAGM